MNERNISYRRQSLKDDGRDSMLPRIAYFTTILLACLVFIFTSIDIAKSNLEQQMTGDPAIFPKSLYIATIALFFGFGFIYAGLNWFYTYDVGSHESNIFSQNMSWNLITFFITSFFFFLYTLTSDLGLIFIFATVFSIQVSCCICLVLLSISRVHGTFG